MAAPWHPSNALQGHLQPLNVHQQARLSAVFMLSHPEALQPAHYIILQAFLSDHHLALTFPTPAWAAPSGPSVAILPLQLQHQVQMQLQE